jgi:hypothetical protein
MHHTQHVLDAYYTPVTATEIGPFKDMQIFMYAVFEDKLKTNKGILLISIHDTTRDDQRIYKEFVKQATSSTAAQLYGDTLLKRITTARYPCTWRG